MLKITSLLIMMLNIFPIKADEYSFSYIIHSPNKYVIEVPLSFNSINNDIKLLKIIDDNSTIYINYPNKIIINNKEISLKSNHYLSNNKNKIKIKASPKVDCSIFIPITISYIDNKQGLFINPFTNCIEIDEDIPINLEDDERMMIDVPETINIGNNEIKIQIDKKYYYKDNKIKISIQFNNSITESSFKIQIPYEYKIEKYIETQTFYAYKKVNEWDDNMLSEKPDGLYKEIKRYGYKEILSYSKDNYLLYIPDEPYYIEEKQYGRMSKQNYRTEIIYCGNDCLLDNKYIYKDDKNNKYCLSYIFDESKEEYIAFEDDWRFDIKYTFEYPYIPIERTVYLLPGELSNTKGYQDTPYASSNNIIPVTETFYQVPLSFFDISDWSIDIPEEDDIYIYQKEMKRYKNEDGSYSNWQ